MFSLRMDGWMKSRTNRKKIDSKWKGENSICSLQLDKNPTSNMNEYKISVIRFSYLVRYTCIFEYFSLHLKINFLPTIIIANIEIR